MSSQSPIILLFVILLLLSCSCRITHGSNATTTTAANATSTLPMDATTLNYCRARLAMSDNDPRDDSMTIGEYVNFCNRLASGQTPRAVQWEHFEEMPQPLQDNYIQLILASKSTSASIDIFGVKPNQQREASSTQLDFIEHICSTTIEAILEAFKIKGDEQQQPDDSFVLDDTAAANNSSATTPVSNYPTQSPTQSPTLSTPSPTHRPTTQSPTPSPTPTSTQSTNSHFRPPSALNQSDDSDHFYESTGKLVAIIVLLMIVLVALVHYCYTYCSNGVVDPRVKQILQKQRETKLLKRHETKFHKQDETKKLVPLEIKTGHAVAAVDEPTLASSNDDTGVVTFYYNGMQIDLKRIDDEVASNSAADSSEGINKLVAMANKYFNKKKETTPQKRSDSSTIASFA